MVELYDNFDDDDDDDDDDNKKGKSDKDEAIISNGRKVPGVIPCKTILPTFNSLAYFVVTPGVSFHSVQEVFCDRPRLSIQGWYHAKEAPSDIENATLNRLKSTAKGEDTEGSFMPLSQIVDDGNEKKAAVAAAAASSKDDDESLSPSDKSYLAKFLNPTYLQDKYIDEIRECFENESSVQLRHFFNEEWSSKVKLATSLMDENDKLGKDHRRPSSSVEYDVGVCDKWIPVGPAHKQRFLEYVGDDDDDDVEDDTKDDSPSSTAGSLLCSMKRSVFESDAFGRWLKSVTSLGMPEGHRGRVRRFRPGLDYTVAHYGILTTSSVLDATMCFVAGKGDQCKYDEETGDLIGSDDDAIWDSGDVGGFECYIAADEGEGEETEADDEYNEDNDTKLLSVSASDNTLSLVYRDPGTMRFVKYVGSGAPSSRWDLSLEYSVIDDDDDEDEEGEKEDSE